MVNRDLRELPAHTISEGALYLRISGATVRCWSTGREDYPPLV